MDNITQPNTVWPTALHEKLGLLHSVDVDSICSVHVNNFLISNTKRLS